MGRHSVEADVIGFALCPLALMACLLAIEERRENVLPVFARHIGESAFTEERLRESWPFSTET